MVLAMGSSVSVFLHLFAEDIYVQVGAKGRCQKWVLKKSITSVKKQKNNPVQQKLGTKNNEKHFSTWCCDDKINPHDVFKYVKTPIERHFGSNKV